MSSMTLRRILAATAIFGLIGCQKSQTGQSDSSSVISQSCKAQASLDTTSMKIVGASAVQAGSIVSFGLNQDVSCSPNAKVSWKAVAPNAGFQNGAQLTTSFNTAGNYVIAAQVQSSPTMAPVLISAKTTVVTGGMSLNGPDYGMARNPVTYTLSMPLGLTVSSATWDFGDASSIQTGAGPATHTYNNPGIYSVKVSVVDSNGVTTNFSPSIIVIPLFDGYECVTQLAISGPTVGSVGVAVPLSVFLPPCIGSRTSGVVWNFGDGTTDTNQSTSHTYTVAGTYQVSVGISVLGAPVANPMFVLTQTIVISPVVTTPPPTTDPNACSVLNQTRQMTGDQYTQTDKCGVNGTRQDIYHDIIVQTCKASGEALDWVETSRTQTLVSQGECKGQACALPANAMTGVGAVAAGVSVVNGAYYLADGATLNFFSSQAPADNCSTVEAARTCSNGTLSGTNDYQYLLCQNGCAGFGPTGTVKTGVADGTVSVPKTCPFGETGVTDLFSQIADQQCNVGTVTTSNVRQGSLVTAGVCPVYSWSGTEVYSACSADCGGTQTQTFVCVDGQGNPAPSARCSGAAPVVTRLCDGNPDAVKRTDVATSTGDDGSTKECPGTQIGVITRERDTTVTTNYACVDHAVAQVSQATTYGDWVEENYCRDYVGYRCSQDSLNNTQAGGRFDWMVKCADQVPVIKEFLDKFATVHEGDRNGNGNYALGDKGRVLYPTFMNREGHNGIGTKCEKPWVAPTTVLAPCDVPKTVYVAAVCLSSCVTPEQQIMINDPDTRRFKYQPAINSWQQQIKAVATLMSDSTLQTNRVKKTQVEQWVTELVDTDHAIIEFTMMSGGVLRVTPNHPVLGADAIMRTADQYKVGDQLIRLGGAADPIVSINKFNYYGKVYNLFVKTSDPRQNVVVTQGYLNGTAYFQNEGTKYLNQAIFRQHLIHGVFGK